MLPTGMSLYFAIGFMISFSLLLNGGDENGKSEPTVVPSVDLNRYVGTWYEIAKIPNRFQRKCDSGTTAEYRLREDGNIDVINRCSNKDGTQIQAKGIAKIVDKTTNAKLKVSFVRILGLSLFWGDYWIIGLGKNYEYAIVGTPSRKYGWILARQPKLPQESMDIIHRILREQGYNPEKLEKTIHSIDSNSLP